MSAADWDAALPQGPCRDVDVPRRVALEHPVGFALDVEGTCMEPLIPDGSRIVVDADMDPKPNEPAVVWWRGARTMRIGIWHDLGFAAFVRPLGGHDGRMPIARPKRDIEAAAPVVWCSAWEDGE